jgi:hypothetical protein
MSERDLHLEPIPPEPLVLTAQDLDLLQHLLPAEELWQLQQANRGELLCLTYEEPLLGMVMIAEAYEGLTFVCLGCGYCEY